MTDEQVQGIADSFHIGKYMNVWLFENHKIIVESSHGLYAMGSLDTEAWNLIARDEKIEELCNYYFGIIYGQLVYTEEYYPNTIEAIPFTHKLGRYWYCLKI